MHTVNHCDIYVYIVNHLLLINLLLTSPNVLIERSINFPAFSLVGIFDMAMTKINARVFAFGRRYQANVHAVTDNFSPYFY